MKLFTATFILVLTLCITYGVRAQNIIITDISGSDSTYVKCDTTTIRVGSLSVQIGQNMRKKEAYSNNSSIIEISPRTWVKVNRFDQSNKFNGHWASLQFGVNGFANSDYSMYEPTSDVPSDFMDLRQAASWEINWNILEWNIALNRRNNFGLVTGMGLSWNNYKFDNKVTIDKGDNGIIYPSAVEDTNFKKSKLMLCYLTVPLMMEYQFPINQGRSKMFVSAGVVGGLNIKSLAKVKANDSKNKDRGSLSIAPFKASGIFQVGGNNLSLYATYSFTELFKDGKGPKLTPFSVGISFFNLW
ncbi:MAG: hypothetical protein ACK5MI_05990 [Mangrovibacterium sp.]